MKTIIFQLLQQAIGVPEVHDFRPKSNLATNKTTTTKCFTEKSFFYSILGFIQS